MECKFFLKKEITQDNYLFKDDIDAFLVIMDSDLLENQGQLDSEIDQVVEKIVTAEILSYTCLLSDKVCLSKGGLTRCLKLKNTTQEVLHPGTFRKMLINRALKFAADKHYPD